MWKKCHNNTKRQKTQVSTDTHVCALKCVCKDSQQLRSRSLSLMRRALQHLHSTDSSPRREAINLLKATQPVNGKIRSEAKVLLWQELPFLTKITLTHSPQPFICFAISSLRFSFPCGLPLYRVLLLIQWCLPKSLEECTGHGWRLFRTRRNSRVSLPFE